MHQRQPERVRERANAVHGFTSATKDSQADASQNALPNNIETVDGIDETLVPQMVVGSLACVDCDDFIESGDMMPLMLDIETFIAIRVTDNL